MNLYIEPIEEITRLQVELTRLRLEHWLRHELFTLQWWLLVLLFTAAWTAWIILVDKKRLLEMVSAAAILAYLITLMDAIGVEVGAWSYLVKEVPLFNRAMAIDLSLPAFFTLLYQYFTDWKQYLYALVATAVLFASLEHAIDCLNFYKHLHWNHYLSFPVYILIGIFIKWLMGSLVSKQQKAKLQPDKWEKE